MIEHVWICLETAELHIAGSPMNMVLNDDMQFFGLPCGYHLEWLGEL